MTGSEVVMKRDDPNIAWGFRLTGGADLGTPFYVVKVLGRGHAERAGLQVGDMVYAINHKYINTLTHKDAQNAILHTGDTLILNIKRGPPDGRGVYSPLPDYADPLMGLVPIPPTERPKPVPPPPYEPPPAIIKEPTPPESEDEEGGEDTVAAFNVKINPKGRIAAIEELPVTPPPSRSSSQCRSRSRSASRDRRRSSTKRESSEQRKVETNGTGGMSGPGEVFTYSKEVVTQYSTVLSAANQEGGQMSETINESFVIHGGSEHKMEDVLSPDDIERDIYEEKMEEQKITELLTGEAELLDEGIVGINFQKIIPKTDFIKESNVFKELQDLRLKKEEPEEEQLKKDPTKRFSTFLQTPKRPIPKPKQKLLPAEELPWKTRLTSPIPESPSPLSSPQNIQTMQDIAQEETIESSTTWTQSVNIIEDLTFRETEAEYNEEPLGNEEQTIITEAVSTENISEEKVRFQDETNNKNEDGYSIEQYSKQINIEEQISEMVKSTITHSEQKKSSAAVEYKSEFEQQLAEIQKQIEQIQQLPNMLQANVATLLDQLNKIVEAKKVADQKEIEAAPSQKRDSIRSQLSWKIDVTVNENKECTGEESCEEKAESTTEQGIDETKTIEVNPENSEVTNTNQQEEPEDSEVAYTNQNALNEHWRNIQNTKYHQREDDEMSVNKPPMIRNFPRTVAERPIVLPGGRKWYTPQDAYNEDFIAETIIHQSEVLVGSTIGLNFRKYEPPKFDASNSAVFRLIHEMEHRCNGGGMPIEGRPEKVLAEEDYFPPISKRHFFAARLAEQTNEHVEKILQDTNEQDIISV